MLLHMLKGKLHMARITEAQLSYQGSITIDEDLMDRVGFLEGEKVQVVNKNNGERFETYVITGPRGSGTICLNGPAARKGYVGDELVIISYAIMTEEEARTYVPKVAILDKQNKVIEEK